MAVPEVDLAVTIEVGAEARGRVDQQGVVARGHADLEFLGFGALKQQPEARSEPRVMAVTNVVKSNA